MRKVKKWFFWRARAVRAMMAGRAERVAQRELQGAGTDGAGSFCEKLRIFGIFGKSVLAVFGPFSASPGAGRAARG